MIQLRELLNILASRFIIVFVGEWGAGKSLSAIAYARLMSEFIKASKIISNLPVYFPDMEIKYEPLTETAQFETLEEDTIIIHDELLNDIDNRNSMSPTNRYLTGFAKSLRKLKAQEVGTAQYLSMVDIRFDELLQVIIFPSFKKRYHKKVSEDMKIRLKNKDFRVKWHIIDKKENKEHYIVLNLYPFINYYDTKFIPSKLAITHNDYLEWFGLSKSKPKLQMLNDINQKTISFSKMEWNEGFERLKVRV